MAPGLAAAAGLVLLSAMKELPITLLGMAPAGFPTLATRIWSSTEDAFWADASVAALALLAVSGVLTWLLVVRRDRGAVVRRLATSAGRWPRGRRRVRAAAAGIGSRASYGAQTTADEPHYLLTALSLAEDGDLDVRDEFADQSYRPFHELALAPQARPLPDGRLIEPHDPCSRRSSRPRRPSAAGSSPS